VLRRWSNFVRATLAADGAEARLVHRSLHGREAEVAAERRAAMPATLEAAIASLEEALGALADAGHALDGLRCDVEVDDAWIVYEVIEADLEDTARTTADALIGAAVADTAGVARDELAVRWQRQSAKRHFACALPSSALAALQTVLARRGLRGGRIAGRTVRAYNALRHDAGPGLAVLAVAGTDGCQLGLLAGREIVALRYDRAPNGARPLAERGRALARSAGFECDDDTRYLLDGSSPTEAAAPWTAGRSDRPWGERAALALRQPRLELDFAPAAGRSSRPLGWLLLAAGALAATAAALQFQGASGAHLRESRALHEIESALAQERTEGARTTPDQARGARVSAAVMRELQVPWARLFAALEAVPGKGVALLSIEPSAQRQELRLVAEAKTPAAMFDFLEALGADPLHDVTLVSHQVQAQAPGAPIRFTARALWEAP
jgi:hypothetical protein